MSRQDGDEALEWLRQAQDVPGVIGIDAMMPRLPGTKFPQRRYPTGVHPRDDAIAYGAFAIAKGSDYVFEDRAIAGHGAQVWLRGYSEAHGEPLKLGGTKRFGTHAQRVGAWSQTTPRGRHRS